MGSKRPYPGEGAPPAARHQKSGNPHSSEYPRSAKKKRKAPKHTTTTTTTTTDQGSKTSFTNVRHRARAIRRLLDKDGGLPANVRNDLERELAAHKATIGERDMQRNRSKMISRYHMVRFFGAFLICHFMSLAFKNFILASTFPNWRLVWLPPSLVQLNVPGTVIHHKADRFWCAVNRAAESGANGEESQEPD